MELQMRAAIVRENGELLLRFHSMRSARRWLRKQQGDPAARRTEIARWEVRKWP